MRKDQGTFAVEPKFFIVIAIVAVAIVVAVVLKIGGSSDGDSTAIPPQPTETPALAPPPAAATSRPTPEPTKRPASAPAAAPMVDIPEPTGVLYVSPNGKPTGDGSEANPIDLQTAVTKPALVKPGTLVWLAEGTYQGPFTFGPEASGEPGKPTIFRAKPGERVQITAPTEARQIILLSKAHDVWLWGLEVWGTGKPELGHYGSVVNMGAVYGDVRFINMYVRDTPNRSAFGGSSLGSTYYGCMAHHNGLSAGALSHGIYVQNRPVDVGDDLDKLPWKKVIDCVFFPNYGYGVHLYATGPKLAKLHLEGTLAYGNGCPEGTEKQVINFLVGGAQFDDLVVVKDCFTYHPPQGRYKRGVDLGYGADNGRLTVEGCYFIGGRGALWLRQWQSLTMRDTTVYTPAGHLVVVQEPAKLPKQQYVMENNTYHRPPGQAVLFKDYKDFNDLASWSTKLGTDSTSRVIETPPTDLRVFVRPNRYEPDKAFFYVYNFPKTETVTLDLGKLWDIKPGQTYRFLELHDIWAAPTAQGTYNGAPVEVPMAGPYAPEFTCFLVQKK